MTGLRKHGRQCAGKGALTTNSPSDKVGRRMWPGSGGEEKGKKGGGVIVTIRDDRFVGEAYLHRIERGGKKALAYRGKTTPPYVTMGENSVALMQEGGRERKKEKSLTLVPEC